MYVQWKELCFTHTHTLTLQHPLPSSPIKNTSRRIPVPYCCTTPGAPSHPTPPPPPSSLPTQQAASMPGNGRTLAQTNTITCLRNHYVLTYPAKNTGENKTDTLAPCMSLCTCIKFCSGHLHDIVYTVYCTCASGVGGAIKLFTPGYEFSCLIH